MKKFCIFFIAAFYASVTVNAQIQVYSNNNVGISTTSANSKLSVNCTGSASYAAMIQSITGGYAGGLAVQTDPSVTSGNNYSIVGYAAHTLSSTGINIGVYGNANSSVVNTASGSRSIGVLGVGSNQNLSIGVYGWLYGTANGAGIYGDDGTGAFNDIPTARYAGFFHGNVKITNTLWVNTTQYTSDERLKTNITPILESEKLFTLRPVIYNFKSLREQREIIAPKGAASLDTSSANTPEPDYIKKKHFGLLAGELAQGYPELVSQDSAGIMGIDYIGLIPLIIEQLKLMKQTMDLKDQKITDLEQRIKQLEIKSKLR